LTDCEHNRARLIQSLVQWAKFKTIEIGKRNGVTFGDIALDFGQAKAFACLAALLTRKPARLYVFHKHAKQSLSPRSKHRLSLEFLTLRWFRRGMAEGSGIPHTQAEQWTDLTEGWRVNVKPEEGEQGVCFAPVWRESANGARDFGKRKEVTIRAMLRQAEGIADGRTRGKLQRLAWLAFLALAEGWPRLACIKPWPSTAKKWG